VRHLWLRLSALLFSFGLITALAAAPAAAAPTSPSRPAGSTTPAPAKSAKSAPATKATGEKTPAQKTPAEQAPAKKTPAQKAPAKQATGERPAAEKPAAAPAEIRPGIPAQLTLTDGTVVPLSAAASDTDLVAQLQGLRERLTEEGMALLGRLMALIPGGNGPSTGRPVLTVTPNTGIRPGSTVSISGKGYRAGEDIYVTQTIAKPASGYPTTYADAQKVTADGKGAFTTTLKITATFSSVDCTRTECFVASFTAFPKLTDRSQDVWVPIALSGSGSGGGAGSGEESPRSGETGSGGGSAGNSAGPRVSVDRASGLNPAGDTVTVHGSGFSTSGPGVYVGIAQTDQFSTTDQSSFGSGTVWVSSSKGNLRQDGSFDVQLPVKAKFGDADCTAHTCAVYTFAAHGSSDRSQDTATPVAFTGGPAADGPVEVPADGGRSRNREKPQNDGPTTAAVSLSTTTVSATGSTPITVNGTGFSTDGPGVYVGVAETGRFSTTDSSVFGAVAWVMPTDISADGSFSKTIEVSPVFGAGNCIENPCAVYTFAAHGSSDRSQDTSTPITVSGTDAEKKAAAKKAADEKKAADKKAAEKKAGEKKAGATKSGEQSDGEQAGDGEQHHADGSDDSTTWWPWAVGGAAVVIAAGVGGYAVRRRS